MTHATCLAVLTLTALVSVARGAEAIAPKGADTAKEAVEVAEAGKDPGQTTDGKARDQSDPAKSTVELAPDGELARDKGGSVNDLGAVKPPGQPRNAAPEVASGNGWPRASTAVSVAAAEVAADKREAARARRDLREERRELRRR